MDRPRPSKPPGSRSRRCRRRTWRSCVELRCLNRRDLDGMLEDWAQDAVLDWSNAHASMPASIGGAESPAVLERSSKTWDEVRLEIVDGL